MNVERTWQAVEAERAGLVEMLRLLPESAWDEPSLCDGWQVRDVVAHLIQSARPTIAWILVNVIRARGDFDRAVREAAVRHARCRTSAQLLAELRGSIGVRVAVAGTTPADRLMDLLVHGQDIAIPLGIPREMPSGAARTALDRLWGQSAPFHVRTTFNGYRLAATDIGWFVGEGHLIEGSAAAILLLITGRSVALSQLGGPGAGYWISRHAEAE
ncbi:MAG: maleylpyruvate isomerase family mycothiol-dependent enzyme [Mycobacteriaceae bacterium]|nr:maleylpyruvate isomerase family mycothiol-dependent enzyme [Mycobacteriaceae bacterium]